LPNALLHALPGGEMGTTAIAISPDGKLIACALAQADISLLSVYEVLSARRVFLTHAHHRTTHELSWSATGDRLLSVSADGTAKIWQPVPPPDSEVSADNPSLGDAVITLAHPTFVFCGRLQPRAPASSGRGRDASPLSLVVTGANDHALRLWDTSTGDGELLATKMQHQARINSVAWSVDGTQLFTADAVGVVRVWDLVARLGATAGADLKPHATIEKPELSGVSINSVAVHPSRRRLLLQTRNSQLLGLETRLQHFSARYAGHKCADYNIRAAYSPDGRFVVAGSEDGSLCAWLEETGEMVLENLPVGLRGPLLQLAWCAQDHVLAMCSYGANNPVLIYYHDPNQASQQLVPTPATTIPQAAAQQSARQQGQAPPDSGSGAAGMAAAGAAATLLARSLASSGSPSDGGRTGSAVRRERRSARRNSETAQEVPQDAGVSGLASRGLRLAPLAADPASASLADGDTMSTRRKAAAAARRALTGPTTPVAEA